MKIPASGELHGRAVEEWVGSTPDTPVPDYVKLRVLLRQSRKCAITGAIIRPGDKTHADHIKRLKDGGENRESNIQIVLEIPHQEKTAKENSDGAKANRLALKHFGLNSKKSTFQASRSGRYRKKINGEVEERG